MNYEIYLLTTNDNIINYNNEKEEIHLFKNWQKLFAKHVAHYTFSIIV